jgi:CRP/FNR family transcriptional regulator
LLTYQVQGNARKASCQSLFASSSDSEPTNACLSQVSVRHLNRGEHVYHEGDSQISIYQVEQGVIRLYRLLADGRRQIMGFRDAGDLVGLCHEQAHFCSAEAITDVTLRSLPVHLVILRIRQDPDLLSELLRIFSGELDDARFQLAMLRRHSALERVAAFVLRYLDSAENVQNGCIRLHVSRSDIADFLNLTVETVCRSLSRLKLSRIIDIPSTHTICILDLPRLKTLSEGGMDLE